MVETIKSRIKSNRKTFVEFLPLPPLNVIRSLGKSQLKILQTLEKGEFVWKGETQKGVMRNKDLEKKLKMRTSTLNSAIKELEKKRFVETKRGVPIIKTIKETIDHKGIEVEEILKNQMLVKITDLGRIQAKKAAMKK